MPAPKTSPGDAPAIEAALADLAAGLDTRDFATTYTGGDGHAPPRLTVASRHAQLTEVIFADATSYWWSWGERLAAVGNPRAAAEKVSRVLHAAPEPVSTAPPMARPLTADEAPGRPASPGQPAAGGPTGTAPAGRPRSPGFDEIIVTPPPGRCLCSSAEHRRIGVLAEVVITFGELGVAFQKDCLWLTNWGKSFALCAECWDSVRSVAQYRRPGLKVTEFRLPRRRPRLSAEIPAAGTAPPRPPAGRS